MLNLIKGLIATPYLRKLVTAYNILVSHLWRTLIKAASPRIGAHETGNWAVP